MARMARVVVPHFPHHITQRGNRKQRTFFSEGDYRAYVRFLVEEKASAGGRYLGLLPDAESRAPGGSARTPE